MTGAGIGAWMAGNATECGVPLEQQVLASLAKTVRTVAGMLWKFNGVVNGR